MSGIDGQRVDATDVAQCFNLFLGKTPEPIVLRRCLDARLHAIVQEVINSEEFRIAVLKPLLLREPLPHEQMAQSPPLRLIDWSQRRLPIGQAARRMAGAARSWPHLLESLLADATLVAMAPALRAAEIDRVLRERLEGQPWSKLERAVVGAVDAASAVEIRGWALDLCNKQVAVTVEIYADNLFIGAVPCSDSRPDVKEAVGGDGMCGFTYKVPAVHRASFARQRRLTVIDSISRQSIAGEVTVSADLMVGLDILATTRNDVAELRTLLERIAARLPDLNRLASVPLEAYGDYWERFYRLAPDLLAEQRQQAAALASRPLISVILPTWNPDVRLLELAITSVIRQTYDRWELIVCNDGSGPNDDLQILARRYSNESRIRWVHGSERAGIADNTNRGIAVATGDYLAFLDHDDELAPDALFDVTRVLQERSYGLVYSDEDRIELNELGRWVHHTPFFKPAYDPDLLLSMNYVCHLLVVRHDVVTAVGGLRAKFDGAQDHDFILRITERLQRADIRHVPRILYHWRVTENSVSRTPALTRRIQDNIVLLVQEHLGRLGCAGTVESHADPLGASRPFATRIRWGLPTAAPAVSVIIPTRDRIDLLRPCIDSILSSAALYPGALEILVVDNDSVETATLDYFAALAGVSRVRITQFHGAFNWSAINNAAADECRGEILIFLNNDTVVLTKDWCTELVANAIRPDVGAVGARLLYADGTLQHAGVVLGVEGAAGHDSVGESPQSGGYFGRTHLQRSAAAVTGACLATRRTLFKQLGGFDEARLKIAFNDVDYCLRLRGAGYRVIYNPFCTLYHFESKSRGFDLSSAQQTRHRSEAAALRERWQSQIDCDPYYNLHFERYARPFDRLCPPP